MWTDTEIVTYLLATIFMGLMTFVAVLVALFGKKFWRPNLKITLANPSGELTSWEKEGKKQSARFYHARIENQRRWSPATNVSLHLIKVQEERLDKTFSEEWIGDVQLKWKHPKYYPQPDKVGKPVDYDLVSVDSGNFVSIHPIVAASSLDRVRKEGCRLRLWLQARSTEIDSLVVIVEISWDGMWVEGNEEMKEHFILTIVNV